MMLRFLSLGILIMGALFFPWWAVALMMVPYATRYYGYELIGVAVLLDGYYGAFPDSPLLTAAAVVVVFVMVFVRPLLRSPELTV
jgi:hypothetical protein